MIEIKLLIAGLLLIAGFYYISKQMSISKKLKKLDNVKNCLSKYRSMMFGVGNEKNLDKARCIQGEEYKQLIKSMSLGLEAADLKDCIQDDTSARLMLNAYGEKYCLDSEQTYKVLNNNYLGNAVLDCINLGYKVESYPDGTIMCDVFPSSTPQPTPQTTPQPTPQTTPQSTPQV